ncbi:MAG TPA: diphosphomevalonate decarboxylase [Thermoanaerobaculia bacterium]|nr:diphosphomevalonate decarboxylase [Thermoanaerobaculia bacterium]
MNERSATAEAASNIAFVKYWGARDLDLAIPVNPSISMTLDGCRSICSATWRPQGERDEVLLAGDGGLVDPGPAFSRRVIDHLARLREWAGVGGAFRIATRNTFPAAAGIASSASGFAALTLAVVRALGRDAEGEELSMLARRSGSGSAARSVYGGYVEWPVGDGDRYAGRQIAGEDHWTLCDVIAVVESGPKSVSSLDGHRRAASSPYFERRQERLPAKLEHVRAAILARDLAALGPVVEEEAVDLHLIAMSSTPPIFYWKPATLAVLEAVWELRGEGVGAWATMDAGANVHVLCEPADEPRVAGRLHVEPMVQSVLRDRVGGGPVWREGAEL